MNEEEKLYLIALSLVPRIGSVLGKQLISYCGSAKAVFNLPKGKLQKIPKIGEKTVNNILNSNFLKEAEQELKTAKEKKVEIHTYLDKSYPKRLKHTFDSPLVIYYEGKDLLNTHKVVGIVGTRKATEYGKGLTEEIVENLSQLNGICVVSGLAYGIDIAAHRACLKKEVPTIGVMATGIDTIYPSAHFHTAKQMREQGGILTENKFHTAPAAPQFPERNRIIAGMSDVIIVVEAANKGGALITAELANSYDREVFAVPGQVHQKFSEGCNALIRDLKAQIFTNTQDFIEAMRWNNASETQNQVQKHIDLESLSTEEQAIFQTLSRGEQQIDELGILTGIPISKLASILLDMEFKDMVKSLPGKRFALTVTVKN